MKTRTRTFLSLGVVGAVLPLVALGGRVARPRGVFAASVNGSRTVSGTTTPHPAEAPLIAGIVEGFNPATARPGPDGRFGVVLADGRRVVLTLDPAWQRATQTLLTRHALPQASVVVLDTNTGRVLVWASHGGGNRDLARVAEAPAASVFKIVTSAALLGRGFDPDATTCYSGGFHQLTERDLTADARRDRECVTLPDAFARSINTVFGRRALEVLDPDAEVQAARAWGFGETLPFEAPVASSTFTIPTDPLGFARTAAGFWNTTLSPLHGALLAQGIALNGEMLRPWIVEGIRTPRGELVARGAPRSWRRSTTPQIAAVLQRAMLRTVSDGTGFHGFHDPASRPYLDGITVGGKTGTLTRDTPYMAYTWFVGNAEGQGRRLSFGVMVGNGPVWRVKAATLARQVLQIALRGRVTD